MRAVNLLPRDLAKTKTRQLNPPLVTAVVAGVVVVAVLAAGFVTASAKVSHKRTELDAARAELALIPTPVAPDTASTALAGERMQRVAALQSALNGRVAWDRVLREISLVLPDDVWLSGLTLQAPDATTSVVPPTGSTTETTPAPAAPTSAPDAFTMDGKAFTHEGVARLLSRLALVPDLENVTLGHSTRTEVGQRAAVEFSVMAGVRLPGATP
jgi:Tfp pilus assembly protein PilN